MFADAEETADLVICHSVLEYVDSPSDALAAIARVHDISDAVVREACVLHRLPSTSTAYWQGWNRLRAKLGGKFHAAFDAVSWALTETPRSSSLVENLNSRLRTYFTLRRRLGGSYRERCGDRPLALCFGMHAAQRFSVSDGIAAGVPLAEQGQW